MDDRSDIPRADEALRESAVLLCQLLKPASSAYAVVDLDGRCMAASAGLARLAGIEEKAAAFEGRSLLGSPGYGWAGALEAVARGQPATLEVGRLPFCESRVGCYQVAMVPLSNPTGTRAAAALVEMRPVSGGSTAESRFRGLLELAPLGILVLREGRVLHANPAATRLLGCADSAELVGSPMREFFLTPSEEVERALTSDLDGTTLQVVEARVLTRSGTVMPVELQAKSTLDERAIAVLLVQARGFAVVLAHPTAKNGASAGSVPDPAEGPARRSGGRTPVVLVCDDEARLAMLTAGLLDQYGYASLTVSNGMDALKALASDSPRCDVILLDLNLPDGNAAEVIGRMRAAGFAQPVILTSGYAEEDIAPELLSDPLVAGYLAKPYSVERLVQVIGRALIQNR